MRITPGASQPRNLGGRAVPKKTLQERYARQAAIERSLSKYLHLECDHYSTLDTDLLYSAWRPKKGRGQSFCEKCSAWRKIKKPPAPPPVPEEPLF